MRLLARFRLFGELPHRLFDNASVSRPSFIPEAIIALPVADLALPIPDMVFGEACRRLVSGVFDAAAGLAVGSRVLGEAGDALFDNPPVRGLDFAPEANFVLPSADLAFALPGMEFARPAARL